MISATRAGVMVAMLCGRFSKGDIDSSFTLFFNEEYYKDVRELTNEHINRYSDNQSGRAFSSCCLVLSSGFFLANYLFDLLPRNTAIWLVFFVLNNLVYAYEYRKIRQIQQ